MSDPCSRSNRAEPSVEERQLIERIRNGEKDEFRVLVERYQGRIFSLVLRQVGSATIAQELTQEIFLKAYRNLGRFRFEASFATWLTRIALNVTHSYFSSRSFRQGKRTSPIDSMTNAEIPDTDSSDRFDHRALQRVALLVTELPPKLRDVFTLCALEQRSYAEVAGILQIPVGTVRSRLNKARLTMQRLYFGDDDEA